MERSPRNGRALRKRGSQARRPAVRRVDPDHLSRGAGPCDRVSIAQFRLGSSPPSSKERLLSSTRAESEEVPPQPLCFTLGRDHGGHWIVQEAHGLCGGLFASKDAAIHFARFESADRQSTIRLASDPIELNCSS
jgi:hypothetical protein